MTDNGVKKYYVNSIKNSNTKSIQKTIKYCPILSFPAGRSVTGMAFLEANLIICVKCIINMITVQSSHSSSRGSSESKQTGLQNCINNDVRMFITTLFLTAKNIRNIEMSINRPALQCKRREPLKNRAFIFCMRSYQCK